MLVADASVLVKVLTGESGTQAALAALVDEDVVTAPDFVTLEVASALSKKVRYHGLPREQAIVSLSALPHFVSEFVPFQDLIAAAFDLSLHLKHAVQDCMYLALAVERGCRVVTADLKFAERARMAGLDRHLVSLGMPR